MRPSALRRRSLGLAALVAALCAAVAVLTPTAQATAPAAAELDEWGPAQVVDARPAVERATALLSTSLGRTAVVYGVGPTAFASSRPEGAAAAWRPPQQLVGAPKDVVAGPVATGSGGGAVAFLKTDFGEVSHVTMGPDGRWSRALPFPYDWDPTHALVHPGSGIVAVGSGRLGGRVHAAVKPQGGSWQRSPALDLEGHKELGGAWYDEMGRPHVLVAQDLRRTGTNPREMYTIVLRLTADGPRWGKAHRVPRGTVGGPMGSLRQVRALSDVEGGLTVTWQGIEDGYYTQLVKHRDPVDGWTPTRELPNPPHPGVVGAVQDDGTSRLAYVVALGGDGSGGFQLVTRTLSADGALGDEEPLDSPASGTYLEAVHNGSGDLLLAWRTPAPEATQFRLFRCPAGSGCTRVGDWTASDVSLVALTPSGTAFMAGVGDAVPGCPSESLCSRRLQSEQAP